VQTEAPAEREYEHTTEKAPRLSDVYTVFAARHDVGRRRVSKGTFDKVTSMSGTPALVYAFLILCITSYHIYAFEHHFYAFAYHAFAYHICLCACVSYMRSIYAYHISYIAYHTYVCVSFRPQATHQPARAPRTAQIEGLSALLSGSERGLALHRRSFPIVEFYAGLR
jgi:hypothetical protein